MTFMDEIAEFVGEVIIPLVVYGAIIWVVLVSLLRLVEWVTR
jgi:hypothetical protein